MPEDLNQKVSQFLDNELDNDEALTLLQKMQLQSELQDKMYRYEAISHAMKSDVFLVAESDFSARIREQIQQEPDYFLPQHKPINRDSKLIALAASIAIVAVIAGRSISDQDQHSRSVSTTQVVAQHRPPEQSANPSAYANQVAKYPLNKRINDYLQAHNSSVYTDEAASQPFARVTTYSHK
jgi:sigma-E factor negative regulatory protein RseA